MIKALPTTYKGIQFRSRTEARWAAYFDLMGVRWRYEDEAYSLSSGAYRPDFYLPWHKVYAEVKGDDGFDLIAMMKVCDLSRETGRGVLLLDGPPDNTTYHLVTADMDQWELCGELQTSTEDVVVVREAGIVCGDKHGGHISMDASYVHVNDRKDRFRTGDWWLDWAGKQVGYGSRWVSASHPDRLSYFFDQPSLEVATIRNATITLTGELIIQRGSDR